MTARSFGTGANSATPAERHLVIRASTWDGGGPLVLVAHGLLSNALTYGPAAIRRDLDYLANTGCLVVAADLAGDAWGNAASVTAAENVITWAASRYGCDTSKVSWLADSMGFTVAVNWATAHVAQVGAIIGRLPATHVDALHDRDGAVGPTVVAAYGTEAAWDAAKGTRDPISKAAALVALKDRIRCFYSTTDTLVLPAEVQAFATAVGCRAVPMGAFAHDMTAMTSQVHAESQASFIWSRL
jgi:hypothetical protein